MAEAMEVQRLVLPSPDLSLDQWGKREGRCRTHMARLLRLSWISPRIVEANAAVAQPKTQTRRVLLTAPQSRGDPGKPWREHSRGPALGFTHGLRDAVPRCERSP